MINDLTVVCILHFPYVQRTNITQCRNALVSPTAPSIQTPIGRHIWLNQASSFQSSEDFVFHCLFSVGLDGDALVVSAYIAELQGYFHSFVLREIKLSLIELLRRLRLN